MSLRDFKTIEERRKYIEDETHNKFSSISLFPDKLKEASQTNCENMIGAVSIPLGIAGPLKIRDQGSGVRDQEVYVPLATTEGALVASVNRGCKAISESGGAYTVVENSGMTRGASFKTQSLKQSLELREFINIHNEDIKKIASSTSFHLQFKSVFTKTLGRSVFVRFSFDCSEAMGMNMATIAVSKICNYLEKETQAKTISVASNFDVDKKPAWLNVILGRGRQVWAEVEISDKTIVSVLKTTAQKMHELNIQKNLLGSSLSGSLGFNAHFANIVSAFFIATGQDPAHVTEGSLGFTTTDLTTAGIAVSIYMPNVNVGTVGGGTKLACQKEALSILGITDGSCKGSADLLASYLGAAVLGGEISLLASLAEGSLASTHKKLGRGK